MATTTIICRRDFEGSESGLDIWNGLIGDLEENDQISHYQAINDDELNVTITVTEVD